MKYMLNYVTSFIFRHNIGEEGVAQLPTNLVGIEQLSFRKGKEGVMRSLDPGTS